MTSQDCQVFIVRHLASRVFCLMLKSSLGVCRTTYMQKLLGNVFLKVFPFHKLKMKYNSMHVNPAFFAALTYQSALGLFHLSH